MCPCTSPRRRRIRSSRPNGRSTAATTRTSTRRRRGSWLPARARASPSRSSTSSSTSTTPTWRRPRPAITGRSERVRLHVARRLRRLDPDRRRRSRHARRRHDRRAAGRRHRRHRRGALRQDPAAPGDRQLWRGPISAGSSRRSGEAGKAEIPIVNASLGTDPLLPAARKAEINSLFADVLHTYSNTLYVVAAGNEGNDNDQLPVYPCNTLLTTGEPDNLLCVGMTNRADLPVCWGNVGPTSVDLFAPGIEILSTVTTATSTGYLRMGGTSTATPMVTGAAALLKAEQGPLFQRDGDPRPDVARRPTRLRRHGRDLGLRRAPERCGRGSSPTVARLRLSKPGGSWKSCDRDHDTIAWICSTTAPTSLEPRRSPAGADTDGDGLADPRRTAARPWPTPTSATPTVTAQATYATPRRAATIRTGTASPPWTIAAPIPGRDLARRLPGSVVGILRSATPRARRQADAHRHAADGAPKIVSLGAYKISPSARRAGSSARRSPRSRSRSPARPTSRSRSIGRIPAAGTARVEAGEVAVPDRDRARPLAEGARPAQLGRTPGTA